MPAWMKWYVSQNEGQFKRFAQKLFGLSSAMEGIKALESWFNKVGTPTRLSQLSIMESDIDTIVENACEHAEAFGLAEIYTKEVLKEILQKAL
jgi:alcohol dehydrogenase YqhD (iron-dependent ADH family)